MRHRPVVIGIFLRAADRFPHLVARDIAKVVIEAAAERAVDVLEIAVEGAAADVWPSGGIVGLDALGVRLGEHRHRSEEHTSELPSLMRMSYAVFCLKRKTHTNTS